MMKRRDLVRVMGAAAVAGLPTAPAYAAAVSRSAVRNLPKGFKWGCATAAFQIEGALKEDGRGESIWDVFSHTPGAIKDGNNADVACDSYHRYADDARCLKELGVQAYRFSFAWPRIFPQGRGTANEKGIDHYKRVVDNLLENGIEPYVTLYHWDLPTALPGGWQSRDTAQAFADYAGYVSRVFGDRVKNFMTLNEIRSFIDIGHGQGRQAPGLKLGRRELNQARHHALLAHGLGMQAIRASAPSDVRIGLAENTYNPIPLIDTPEHVAAARKAFRWMNASLILPILEGRYSDEYHQTEGADAAQAQNGDMAAIGSSLDFIGTNIYTGDYVAPDPGIRGYRLVVGDKLYPRMGLPFLRMVPEAAYWGIRWLSEAGKGRPIYISENGCTADDIAVGDAIDDPARIMYLRAYLGEMQRAIAEGYPVKGYFCWSLMDNFEWSDGFVPKFGLYHLNRENQKRSPKQSALWLREVIVRNAMV